MQTRQILITFRTFIGQKNKRNPTLNLFYGSDQRPPSARKSRTRDTDRVVGTPCPAASHALLILGGVPNLGGAGVGQRQVGCVADGAPVVGRQRVHRLCGRVCVRLRRYCVARGDLSEGDDLELHPRRQALLQSVRACGQGGCGAR